MPLPVFNALTERDKSRAVEKLIAQSTPRQDFFLMVVLAVAMATFGVLLDSPAVIIGSMLIAPILYPILGISMGVIMSDAKLISRSFMTVAKSIGLAVGTATLITLLAKPIGFGLSSATSAWMDPSLAFAAVALIAGLAASFALVKEQLSETLPGIAISVSLIPPLAVIGVGLAHWDWVVMGRSFLMFLVNTVGIVFASMVIFSLMNFYVKRTVAEQAIAREDKKVEREKAEAANGSHES